MSAIVKEGDIVKHADADEPGSIPAYRALRGVVLSVSEDGKWVRVHWTVDKTPEPFRRSIVTLRVTDEGEATCS